MDAFDIKHDDDGFLTGVRLRGDDDKLRTALLRTDKNTEAILRLLRQQKHKKTAPVVATAGKADVASAKNGKTVGNVGEQNLRKAVTSSEHRAKSAKKATPLRFASNRRAADDVSDVARAPKRGARAVVATSRAVNRATRPEVETVASTPKRDRHGRFSGTGQGARQPEKADVRLEQKENRKDRKSRLLLLQKIFAALKDGGISKGAKKGGGLIANIVRGIVAGVGKVAGGGMRGLMSAATLLRLLPGMGAALLGATVLSGLAGKILNNLPIVQKIQAGLTDIMEATAKGIQKFQSFLTDCIEVAANGMGKLQGKLTDVFEAVGGGIKKLRGKLTDGMEATAKTVKKIRGKLTDGMEATAKVVKNTGTAMKNARQNIAEAGVRRGDNIAERGRRTGSRFTEMMGETITAMSQRFGGKGYAYGSKSLKNGGIDCSGWVAAVQQQTIDDINGRMGKGTISARKARELRTASGGGAAGMLKYAEQIDKGSLKDEQITAEHLKDGMILAMSNRKSKNNGRHKNIGHIVTVFTGGDGKKYISESASADNINGKRVRSGVRVRSLDEYLATEKSRRSRDRDRHLYAADPYADIRRGTAGVALAQNSESGMKSTADKTASPIMSATASAPLYTGTKSQALKQAFLNRYHRAAREVSRRMNGKVSPEGVLAQWAQESGWGEHITPGTGFNLWNHKADKNRTGKKTATKILDKATGSRDYYRVYDEKDLVRQGVRFFSGKRYRDGIARAGNDREFFAAVAKGGYAEDKNYLDNIMRIASDLKRNTRKAATGSVAAPLPQVPKIMRRGVEPALQNLADDIRRRTAQTSVDLKAVKPQTGAHGVMTGEEAERIAYVPARHVSDKQIAYAASGGLG